MPLGQADSADVSPTEDIIDPPEILTRANERTFLSPSSPPLLPSLLIDRSTLPRPSGINPVHADILPPTPNYPRSGRTRSDPLLAASNVRPYAAQETQDTENIVAAIALRDQGFGRNSVSPSNTLDTSFFERSPDPGWDPSHGSFLDLIQLYEPQGQLADEHNDPARGPDESLPKDSWSKPTTSLDVVTPAVPASGAPLHSSPPQPSDPGFARRSSTKRKADSESTSSTQGRVRAKTLDSRSREGDSGSISGRVTEQGQHSSLESALPSDRPYIDQGAGGPSQSKITFGGNSNLKQSTSSSMSTPGASRQSGQNTKAKSILPPEKVFPIQIGSELFRLSGASIASDAPSYFSHFFEEQLRQNEEGAAVRTLYIDRDPVTFQDVSRHLQGYYVRPRDGSHFVKLFADAQFYSLPRLISQLFESEIFIQIGDKHFQIPRDIFSGPGDSPNFFSLGFAVFFASPAEVFPGLERKGLLRPPSIAPPIVINRSAEVFAELLHMLRGYPIHIRNEEHRAELLRDCRYFHLRGLEQKLIPHHISYNLERQKSEIVIRLEDIRQSGVQFVSDVSPADTAASGGWVHYSRPFIDDTSHELVVEIGGESMFLDLNSMRTDLHGLAKARISSLFQVVANKMNLPTNAPLGLLMMSGGASAQSASPGRTPLSEDRVKIRIDADADVVLDGETYLVDRGVFSSWNSATAILPAHVEHIPISSYQTSSSASNSTNDPDSGEILSAGPKSRASNLPMPLKGSPTTEIPTGAPHPHIANAPNPLTSPLIPRGQSGIRLQQAGSSQASAKRKRKGSMDELREWVVRNGQWRLRVQANTTDTVRGGMEIVFVAVKLDALTGQRARNASRAFLG